MIDENSQEYKLVMSLFDGGKINENERDRLLAALDSDGTPIGENADTESGDDIFEEADKFSEKHADADKSEEPKNAENNDGYRVVIKYAVDGNFSASEIKDVCAKTDGVQNVRTDTASKTFTASGDFDNSSLLVALNAAGYNASPVVIDVNERGRKIHVNIDDGDMHVDIDDKPAGEYIKSALGKVSSFFGKGVKTVGRAGEKIARAAGDIVNSVGDFISDAFGTGDEPVRMMYNEEYDEPYEEMTVSVKYVSCGGGVFKYSARTTELAKLKAKCVAVMSEKFYGELYDLFEEKFTGTFKLVQGGEVLKIKVRPTSTKHSDDED